LRLGYQKQPAGLHAHECPRNGQPALASGCVRVGMRIISRPASVRCTMAATALWHRPHLWSPQAVLAERLDIALPLHNEDDWCFGDFPQTIKNLPQTLPPRSSPPWAVRSPLFEVLRLVADDLIQQLSVFVGVVVKGHNPRFLRRSDCTAPKPPTRQLHGAAYIQRDSAAAPCRLPPEWPGSDFGRHAPGTELNQLAPDRRLPAHARA